MDNKVITKSDLKKYKTILEMINAHLEGFEPGNDMLIVSGSNFTKVISKMIPQTKRSVHWVTYWRDKMTGSLFYDPDNPSAFSSLANLQANSSTGDCDSVQHLF